MSKDDRGVTQKAGQSLVAYCLSETLPAWTQRTRSTSTMLRAAALCFSSSWSYLQMLTGQDLRYF